MSKSLIVVLAIVGVVVLIGGCGTMWGVSTYNNCVTLDQEVQGKWAQVQNQYQRRYDLIPNLVEIVKGYATHESNVLVKVAEARASVGSIKMTPELLNNPEQFKKFQAAQGELSQVLSRLMVVTENYPNLKANEGFLQLQAQLEGTENRIAVERMRFNEASQNYNTMIRVFPGSMIAGMFGFSPKPYFEAETGADKAPKVKF